MKEKAHLFILLGQSQAVGHALPMREEDRITVPLTHVFGLDRAANQSFDVDRLTWSGYVSGGMNLGETQDHTYSLANCLAALWQKEIDGGRDLPDLYVIQIAIGAEGVTEKYAGGAVERPYMWNPDKEKVLKPGKLGQVDIALFPLTQHILSLVGPSFAAMGRDYDVTLYWRGGENDTETPPDVLKKTLAPIYDRLFDGFYAALGRRVPTVLNRIVSFEIMTKRDPSGDYVTSLVHVNDLFDELAAKNGNMTVFDARRAPHYQKSAPGNGIFIGDLVHYNAETNRWCAEEFLRTFGQKG